MSNKDASSFNKELANLSYRGILRQGIIFVF